MLVGWIGGGMDCRVHEQLDLGRCRGDGWIVGWLDEWLPGVLDSWMGGRMDMQVYVCLCCACVNCDDLLFCRKLSARLNGSHVGSSAGSVLL